MKICQTLQTSFGGYIYLFGEGNWAFFRGLLDRSLLLLLHTLIDGHISDYMQLHISQSEKRSRSFAQVCLV